MSRQNIKAKVKTFRLPIAVSDALDKAAVKQGRTRQAIVIRALKAHLEIAE